ncbi:MAG TPA: ABC transporter permease [Candidatus Acidoferrales bacterium]|nr:ABC transporter permease [Candidatus Acidoferrales bacterium]
MPDAPTLRLRFRQASVTLREATLLALDTLRAHKMRSFLTLLGVILAVTTLVAVMSVLNGLNLYISTKVANLGANAFVIDRIGIITNRKDFLNALKRPPLRMEDYYALKGHLKYAQRAAAEEDTTQTVHYGENIMEDISVIGATPEFAEVRDFDIASGRFMTAPDELHRTPVCFIGHDVVDKLFGGLDPLGREIRVGAQQCEVIGTAKPLGSVFGESQDNFVMMPLSTYLTVWQGADSSVTIFVEAINMDAMPAAEDEARVLLRARHHMKYQDADNFGIVAPSSIMSVWQSLTGNIFGIAVWLTSVFLVVGGIVIMNIMLASVTERTREIGLRKSLGARRRHIVLQFLMESSILAASGGAAGIVAAWGVALLVRATTPMPISMPLQAVVIALVLSTSVGLFFGIYPAVRASRLDPIEALRAET